MPMVSYISFIDVQTKAKVVRVVHCAHISIYTHTMFWYMAQLTLNARNSCTRTPFTKSFHMHAGVPHIHRPIYVYIYTHVYAHT